MSGDRTVLSEDSVPTVPSMLASARCVDDEDPFAADELSVDTASSH